MKRALDGLALGLACAFLALAVFSGGGFADPDSYYHIRAATILPHGTFPWASASTWATAYADKDWLFHVALVPFVRFLPEIVGGKVAAFVFASGLVLALAFVLARRKAPWPGLLAGLAVVSSYLFLMRILALRTLTPAVTLALVLILVLLERRLVLAFVVSLVYPLLYTAAQVPLGLALACALGLRWKGERLGGRIVGAVVLGTLAGLLLHPDFPRNVTLTWQQNVLVLANVWADSSLGLAQGNEFRGFSLGNVVWGSAPLLLALILATSLAVFLDEKTGWRGLFLGLALLGLGVVGRECPETVTTRDALAWGLPAWILLAAYVARSVRRSAAVGSDTATALLLAGGAAVATALSARFFEYLAPFGFLALGLVLRDVVGDKATHRRLVEATTRGAPERAALGVVLLLSLVSTLQTLQAVSWFRRGFPASRYSGTGAWLQLHARPGEVVYHARWDAFPELFFHAPNQRYVVALDPIFLWLADPDQRRYKLWSGIGLGTLPPEAARELGGARLIVTDATRAEYRALGEHLRADGRQGKAVLRDRFEGIELWELTGP